MMTNFNTLFNRMFQEKSKSVYLIYLIQAFASLCFTIMLTFSARNQRPELVFGRTHESTNIVVIFLLMFAIMMLITSFVANFVYWIISSVKNEKINRSQTWRLIPISDTKFLLSNFGTAFFSYIWLGVLETATIIITSLPLLLSSNEIKEEIQRSNFNLNIQDWGQLLGSLMMMILLGYAWYAVVSLINLSSRSIMDFLPSGSSKALMFLVRLIIIIMVIWLLSYAASTMFSIIGQFTPFEFGDSNLGVDTTVLEFLAFDIVITLIDILLLNKFVEAK